MKPVATKVTVVLTGTADSVDGSGGRVFTAMPAMSIPERVSVLASEADQDCSPRAGPRRSRVRELEWRAAPRVTVPRGYAPHSQHPPAEFLRLKQYVVARPLTKQAWLDVSSRDDIVGFVGAIPPLLTWVAAAQA